MNDGLYTSCAEVLSLFQPHRGNLEQLLDPQEGFAPKLRKICHDQLTELQEAMHSLGGAPSQEEIDALVLEENTWALLQALIGLRQMSPTPKPTARSLLRENPYTPTATLAQAIMQSSPLLSELIIVREWLQDIASDPKQPEASNGYWKMTRLRLEQELRAPGSGGLNTKGMVKEMDPDAIGREENKALAADDAGDEKALMQALYSYIRSGRLYEATELCRKAHQPWRAASINGALLFRWSSISSETDDDAVVDEEADNDQWYGNRRRKLWKAACSRAALNPNLPDPERVLYSSLAPSPQTYTVLKSACRSWEDYAWAQISVICEEKQSSEIDGLGGSFWEGGLAALEQGVRDLEPQEEEEEAIEWEKEVLLGLESLASVRVEDGPPADHAFHVSQLHIILNKIDTLLDTFASKVRDGLYNATSLDYPTMTRFFAHLCLYLQLMEIPVPPLATQIILEAYLQVLEHAGQRDLIAMYAGALGDNAVQRYALFLTSLELSVDVRERALALDRANEHGLDVDKVAISTAEHTIERAFQALPSLAGPLPSAISLATPATDAEQLLLRSIEWTTFKSSTYSTALEQANVILRYFLASGRLHLAKSLLDQLPVEIATVREPEELATEYLHYRQFFSIWETLDRIVECQSLERPDMNKETRLAWLKDYGTLIEQAREQIIKLLTSEWLTPDDTLLSNPTRASELMRVRRIYVPEMIIRLHGLLYISRSHIPQNLKRALQLANIVADSRYRLYEDFTNQSGRRLSDYLDKVRTAVLGGLEAGGSDPFRVLQQQ